MALADRPTLITISSPKGGVGKTVTTILLAGEYAQFGHKVLVIDTDPQQSVMSWYNNSVRSGYPLNNIEAVSDPDAKKLRDRLLSPQGETIILIDVQGTAAAALSGAVNNAHFVVIPTKAHIFDVQQAIGLVSTIEMMQGLDRKIPYGVFLNQVNGIDKNTLAFRTATKALTDSKVNVLDSFLSLRPTFAGIATAGSLYEVDGTSNSIRDARDQSNALAGEIISRLNEATP